MSWLSSLWSRFRGFWVTPAGQAIERAALDLVWSFGQALLDRLFVAGIQRARELEASYGPGTGAQKAAALDEFLKEAIVAAGKQALPRLVNRLRENIVGAAGV